MPPWDSNLPKTILPGSAAWTETPPPPVPSIPEVNNQRHNAEQFFNLFNQLVKQMEEGDPKVPVTIGRMSVYYDQMIEANELTEETEQYEYPAQSSPA